MLPPQQQVSFIEGRTKPLRSSRSCKERPASISFQVNALSARIEPEACLNPRSQSLTSSPAISQRSRFCLLPLLHGILSLFLPFITPNWKYPPPRRPGGRRCSPSRCPLPSRCPVPSLLPCPPSVPHLHLGRGKSHVRSRCPPWDPASSSPRFFFFLPSLLLLSPKKLSRFSVPSARVAILTCPREKGAPTIATEWTDLIWTQGICPWRRRETLLLRNMIARERNRPRRSGSVQLRTSSECRFPQLRCFTRQALRPVTSAPFGHTPSQPPVHLLRGPQFSRAWGTPTVESPVDLSSFSLDTPPMPKP